ncbi:hypothetical protein BGZ67_003341 [Mortierella alpina]|nr:hypothetical protein BGZ67_003341 [Mortierella alpina]
MHPINSYTTSTDGKVLRGIAQGEAIRNVHGQTAQDLMFFAGEQVVLLERLESGLCMPADSHPSTNSIGNSNGDSVAIVASAAFAFIISIANNLPLDCCRGTFEHNCRHSTSALLIFCINSPLASTCTRTAPSPDGYEWCMHVPQRG